MDAIEAMHRQFRKLTKTKGSFPCENILLKLLYLWPKNAQEKMDDADSELESDAVSAGHVFWSTAQPRNKVVTVTLCLHLILNALHDIARRLQVGSLKQAENIAEKPHVALQSRTRHAYICIQHA